MYLSSRILAVVTASLLLAACDKKPASDSAPAGSASSTTTTAAAPTKDMTTVLATCNDPSVNICREYFGLVPMLAEDLCKGLEGKGVLTRGNTPCSRDSLLGTCVIKGDDASETHYYYRTQAGDDPDLGKASCELKQGAWTAAPAPAASAKPAASGKAKARK